MQQLGNISSCKQEQTARPLLSIYPFSDCRLHPVPPPPPLLLLLLCGISKWEEQLPLICLDK